MGATAARSARARRSTRNSRASARSTAELDGRRTGCLLQGAVFLRLLGRRRVSPSGARRPSKPRRPHAAPARPRRYGPGLQRSGDQHVARHARSVASPSSGSGVTVAVIDSGIYPSPAFAGPHQGVLRLHRRRHPRQGAPYDDYGHGTHVAGLIGGMQGVHRPRIRGRGAERAVRRPQGAGQERRRPDQRRHPRDRVRDREQEERLASTSSTCRSATRFSSRPRTTRSCRRLRRPRRPASSWSRRRATMASTKTARLVLPASRRRATRRPR